jgi:hypothetical protein
MSKKLSLSQVLDVMNDSDSGSQFEDNIELDTDYDVNFDNFGNSDSGNDTDVHGMQCQGQGGTKNVQPGTTRPMDIDNHDTDGEDGGGTNIFLFKCRSY